MNKGFNVETRGCLLPYKNPEKQKEAMRKIMRDYRKRQREKKEILQKLGLVPTVSYEVV